MLTTVEQFVWDVIDEEGGLEPVDIAMEAIVEYLEIEYEYESKNIRLDLFAENMTMTDIYHWVTAIFTAVLIHKEITYQALCGMLQHKIKADLSVPDKVKTVAEMIAIISKTGLIHIEKQGPGKNILIRPGFDLGMEIPQEDRHPLIFEEPQTVTDNKSLMLGNPMNQHDGELCLDHINRMNRIQMSINERFLGLYVETPKKPLDTLKKAEQWEKFAEDSWEKYAEFLVNGNRGYLKHAYCTRGRSYATGYHITTQGAPYKKAILELANKEIVEDGTNAINCNLL